MSSSANLLHEQLVRLVAFWVAAHGPHERPLGCLLMGKGLL